VSRRLAVALAVVAVAGGIVAIGIAVRADKAAPGPPSTATPAGGVPGTSRPPTTARPPADRATADWPMFGYDAARTNVAPRPTGVTTGSVAGLRLRVVAVPGTVDSSPIFLHGVRIDGRRRDAFFMTTTYGRTLALSPAGRILWTFTPAGYASVAGSTQITTATPAADPGRRFVYAASPDGLIHKLAIGSGREQRDGGWPVRVTLLPEREKIASALNVRGRFVYVTTGGYVGDAPPYQGHVVLITLGDGRIAAVFNTLCSDVHRLQQPASCPQSDSAIWGRAGAVVDPASGEILVATGNAPFNGRTAWGDSILALHPDASGIGHSYTPSDQADLDASDLDLGSSAPAVLRAGPLIAQAGKDGVLRLVDLGKHGTGTLGGELQTLPTPGREAVFTALAVWRRPNRPTMLFLANGSGTAAYRLTGTGSAARLAPVWSNDRPGTSPVLAGGVLYVYDPGGSLAAYDPADGRRLATLPAGTGHWSSPIVADSVVVLPVGDANDHATTGEIDLYSR
jgi:putative pyrroloquinoline-quinone-binding quinoprotein